MTIEEARNVYQKNNCSLFVMAREDFDNYILYRELNIDKKSEQQWREEIINNLILKLKETGNDCIFEQLYDLMEGFHGKKNLEFLMEALDYVKIYDDKLSLCIAECIMGRKILSVRSGMIFWAYDIGEKGIAIILIKKVMSLINIKTDDREIKERINIDWKTIREIVDILDLGIDINLL